MDIYDVVMTPVENTGLSTIRKNIVSIAHGDVLEIGVGSGANLTFYNFSKISSLKVSDKFVSKGIFKKLKIYSGVKFYNYGVEKLNFEDESFDCVVASLVFCTVKDVNKALLEIKRVLKKDGKLIFLEHIKPEKKPFSTIFDKINPFWRKIAKGCNLNRDFLASLDENGYDVKKFAYGYKKLAVYGVAEVKR